MSQDLQILVLKNSKLGLPNSFIIYALAGSLKSGKQSLCGSEPMGILSTIDGFPDNIKVVPYPP